MPHVSPERSTPIHEASFHLVVKHLTLLVQLLLQLGHLFELIRNGVVEIHILGKVLFVLGLDLLLVQQFLEGLVLSGLVVNDALPLSGAVYLRASPFLAIFLPNLSLCFVRSLSLGAHALSVRLLVIGLPSVADFRLLLVE